MKSLRKRIEPTFSKGQNTFVSEDVSTEWQPKLLGGNEHLVVYPPRMWISHAAPDRFAYYVDARRQSSTSAKCTWPLRVKATLKQACESGCGREAMLAPSYASLSFTSSFTVGACCLSNIHMQDSTLIRRFIGPSNLSGISACVCLLCIQSSGRLFTNQPVTCTCTPSYARWVAHGCPAPGFVVHLRWLKSLRRTPLTQAYS